MKIVKAFMLKEIKLKIVRLLKELNQSKSTIIGVIAFLKNIEDAKEMLTWLEENKEKNLTQHQIIDKLDLITM